MVILLLAGMFVPAARHARRPQRERHGLSAVAAAARARLPQLPLAAVPPALPRVLQSPPGAPA